MNGTAKREGGGTEANEAHGAIEGALKVIPSVYYDIIARICPGIAFMLCLSLDNKDGGSFDLDSIEIPNVFALIVLSYIAGMILTGVSGPWAVGCLWVLRFDSKHASRLGIQVGEGALSNWARITERVAKIGKASSEEGHAVAKMQAEVALCENLLTGLLVLIVAARLTHGLLFPIYTREGPFQACAWVLVLMLLVATIFREVMLLGRVKVAYTLYVEESGGSNEVRSAV